MSLAAEAALRTWINGHSALVGDGNPLALGAYLRAQRSPGSGAYAVISRSSEGVTNIVAEADSAFSTARMQCLVFAGTEQSAEAAAAALRTLFETLTGCPEPCGDGATIIRVADNHLGPLFIQAGADNGEQYCFQVNADFVLTAA